MKKTIACILFLSLSLSANPPTNKKIEFFKKYKKELIKGTGITLGSVGTLLGGTGFALLLRKFYATFKVKKVFKKYGYALPYDKTYRDKLLNIGKIAYTKSLSGLQEYVTVVEARNDLSILMLNNPELKDILAELAVINVSYIESLVKKNQDGPLQGNGTSNSH